MIRMYLNPQCNEVVGMNNNITQRSIASLTKIVY